MSETEDNASNTVSETMEITLSEVGVNELTKISTSDTSEFSVDNPDGAPSMIKYKKKSLSKSAFSRKLKALKRRPLKKQVGDSEVVKAEKKRKSMESNLKKISCTLSTHPSGDVGKRQKKAPQRYVSQQECPSKMYDSGISVNKGQGQTLHSIPLIRERLENASILAITFLHKIIFLGNGAGRGASRKKKEILKFSGFPFVESSDQLHLEMEKRRELIRKHLRGDESVRQAGKKRTHINALRQVCDVLCQYKSTEEAMMNRILAFLQFPKIRFITQYIKDTTPKSEPFASPVQSVKSSMQQPVRQIVQPPVQPTVQQQQVQTPIPCSPPICLPKVNDEIAYSYFKNRPLVPNYVVPFPPIHGNANSLPVPYNAFKSSLSTISMDRVRLLNPLQTSNGPNADGWVKPAYIQNGPGMKLKFIQMVSNNINTIHMRYIEILHRLLFIHGDHKHLMRRNILEFSGFCCQKGTSEYSYRLTLLSYLPLDQLKLICQIFDISSHYEQHDELVNIIMAFLVCPRVSSMKNAFMPTCFGEEVPFSYEGTNKMASDQIEEIEIIPDIHILDEEEDVSDPGEKGTGQNEFFGVKLKTFSGIRSKVLDTAEQKLNDLHLILYGFSCHSENVRNFILDFPGFPFGKNSSEYRNRKDLMMIMTLDCLKSIASVLCISQYVLNDSKLGLIDAILKFLMKPSALLNDPTGMHITPPSLSISSPVQQPIATSAVVNDSPPGIVISKVQTLAFEEEADSPAWKRSTASEPSPSNIQHWSSVESDIEKMRASLSSDIQIMPASKHVIKEEPPNIEIKPILPITPNLQNLRRIKKEPVDDYDPSINNATSEQSNLLRMPLPYPVSAPFSCPGVSISATVQQVKMANLKVPEPLAYNDDEDTPLIKMIGHPNDDQLRQLVAKFIKESHLQDITMRHVIKQIFSTYPNYDLGYRREFIKSTVRQILSHMESSSCFVTTTVTNV